jgi:L-2-hydroxyglutarate oxidase LhgO
MESIALRTDVAVVGAGVVGLAIAARIAEAGPSVVVVERNAGPGRETSSRSSEVIHAGLYYPTGSLKARLCVEGNALLNEFCAEAGVAHRRIGKLVVAASDAELPALEELHTLAAANGARELTLIDARELAALEPAVHAHAALWSPSTGIVDSHALVKALEGRARAAGAQLLYRCRALRIEVIRGGYVLEVEHPAGEERVHCRALVNAAGLESDRVAALAGVDRYRLHWCRGDYFAVSGPVARSVHHLVYPLPGAHASSLGVHVTLDLAGRMRLGPDATYVEREPPPSLDVAAEKADAFWRAARRYLPALELEHLHPDTAGLRPKLQAPGAAFCDFVIREELDADRAGLFNLVGIESPGLTACLAIADLVRPAVLQHLAQ